MSCQNSRPTTKPTPTSIKKMYFSNYQQHLKKIHIVWNEKVRFGGYIQSVCCLLPMTLMNRNTDQLSVTPADALLHCISSLKHDFWCEGHPTSITVSSLFSIPLQIIFFQHRGSHFVSLKIFYINHLFPKLRLLRNGCRGIKHGQTL